jgi:hypothetical protein
MNFVSLSVGDKKKTKTLSTQLNATEEMKIKDFSQMIE